MKQKKLLLLFGVLIPALAFAQNLTDDFEGNGNINTWKGDDCLLKTDLPNPYKSAANNSAQVLEYADIGGLYANVRFDVAKNFDLSRGSLFLFKIYIPSNKISGNQTKQVSLKLQNGNLAEPWSTQSEIIKPLLLDQWQTVTFDFAKDAYKNLNGGSLPPVQRKDFNRVVIQVNGENNKDSVVAYLDDFEYVRTPSPVSIYNKLVWADEFDTAGAVSSAKWFHQTQLPAAGSWYNGEIQHYTNRTSNSIVENGILKLIAKKESFTDQGFTKEYTSARLNSKFAFKYGRVEFRAKLPTGAGTWPAIWMLGKNIRESGAYWDNMGFGTVTWPACGEIDILEHWGNNQNYVQSAIHSPSSFGNTINLGGQVISTASTEFHLYSMEWTPEKMVFSVDSVVHYTYEPAERNMNTWPFDAEQYLLINIAIQPGISPSFSQSALELDYIRVYQENTNKAGEIDNNPKTLVYPNPFINHVSIVMDNVQQASVPVQIFTLDGRLVLSNTYVIENNILSVDKLDVLSNGAYVLSYISGNRNTRVLIFK
jgi:beta-glucanase (GH16 family)